MHIISASRRTDIPHYFAEWFAARRRAGFAEYRTVFGGGRHGRYRVSLQPEDVLGYLFWTKYAGPFHGQLAELRSTGMPYVFQYTISGYGREIQPGIPERAAAIEDFLKVSENLPTASAIQWRYDPIMVSPDYSVDWHLTNFDRISEQLHGATNVVNVSFIEPYLKALSKAPDWRSIHWRTADPLRHTTTHTKYADARTIGTAGAQLLTDLSHIARKRGIELRVCCNEEYSGMFPAAKCCGRELFQEYGTKMEEQLASRATGPSRPACRCLKTVDIGMDTTCPGGCFYCYVTTSTARALKNYELHDPNASMLRNTDTPNPSPNRVS